jgi:hypothetical protein
MIDPLVEAIRVMSDSTLENDRALLKLIEALVEKVDRLEDQVSFLIQNDVNVKRFYSTWEKEK